jgi:nucleotide-binding universal stress UspA family protein
MTATIFEFWSRLMIKDVILNLELNTSRDSVRDYALEVAKKFDAHLEGVAFADCANAPVYQMPDFDDHLLPEFDPTFLADMQVKKEAVANNAIERFKAAVRGSLLSVGHRLVTESPSSTSFSVMARHYDISVIMQSDAENWVNNDTLIEAALLDSGRPVIVVPYIQKEGLKLDRIVCCWDGSRAAARAINDALPLLQNASAVELLIVTNEKISGGLEIRGVEISSHLARHGVNVELVTVPATDIDVANVILSRITECSANMIVMGGYGHSRLREFILGGTKRGVLTTMTVPVFISH